MPSCYEKGSGGGSGYDTLARSKRERDDVRKFHYSNEAESEEQGKTPGGGGSWLSHRAYFLVALGGLRRPTFSTSQVCNGVERGPGSIDAALFGGQDPVHDHRRVVSYRPRSTRRRRAPAPTVPDAPAPSALMTRRLSYHAFLNDRMRSGPAHRKMLKNGRGRQLPAGSIAISSSRSGSQGTDGQPDFAAACFATAMASSTHSISTSSIGSCVTLVPILTAQRAS